MISKHLLNSVLDYVIGKRRTLPLDGGKQISLSLKVYLDRGEFDPNLNGEELYKNAKECLEMAGYEVE